ncbi:hypothetical protein AWJ20_2584 [Sugiyamaella lignohabitans]|uniref:DNA polymerase delta subunit 4 n=1 Tax=Sugiyamaella lignohabitans TaxID=796027 RepID=A0A167F8R2_9ASCO|nr:uncharacterized protein AWJ20_2584 [Sugiyamaella lignohabitans]ANB14965.1 hypothetical protein AWJ20_2584 [Sugiyamaella lignohabitans]
MAGKKETKGQTKLTGSFGVSKRGSTGVGKTAVNAAKKSSTAQPILDPTDNSTIKGVFSKPGLTSEAVVGKKDLSPGPEEKESTVSSEIAEKDTVVKNESKPLAKLDVEKPEYKNYLRSMVKNRISEPIHQEEYNTAEKVLKQFDMTAAYGPTAGITRLERWNRADKLGLNPPALVKEILETKEGVSDSKYSESYLYGYV